MSATDTAREFLTDNPRMMGVLFMTLLLLSQAQAAAAGGSTTVTGP